MTTVIINLNSGKACDILIDRRTKWGNPFHIGPHGTRAEVIEKYRTWITEQPQLMYSLKNLRDKRLGCWCAPKPCHGDVLLQLLEAGETSSDQQEVTTPPKEAL